MSFIKMKKIGRNDPCSCGSGRKYKRCCFEKDEKAKNAAVVGEYYEKVKEEDGLSNSQLATRKALDWILEKHEDVVIKAFAHFIGGFKQDKIDKAFQGEEGKSIFSQLLNEYALIDYEDEDSGKTLLELYLEEKNEMLNEEEKESLQIKLNTYKTLYEVQKIIEGKGIFLKNIFNSEEFWIKEKKATFSVKKWDIIFARVETYSDGVKKITGSIVDFPRESLALDDLKIQYQEEEKLFRKNVEMLLFDFRHLITPLIFQSILDQYASFADNFMRKLVNKEGDKLVFCEKTADIADYAGIIFYFENNKFLTLTYEDEKEKVYCWLDKNNSVIASFYVKNKKLTIETNSEKRMEIADGKFMLDLEKLARNWRIELKDPKILAGKTGGGDDNRELTMETKYIQGSDRRLTKKEEEKLIAKQLKKHYDDWIDMEILALFGMTPRQASNDPENKKRLIELLKTMENKDLHSKNIVGFDIKRMKRKLGLEF